MLGSEPLRLLVVYWCNRTFRIVYMHTCITMRITKDHRLQKVLLPHKSLTNTSQAQSEQLVGVGVRRLGVGVGRQAVLGQAVLRQAVLGHSPKIGMRLMAERLSILVPSMSRCSKRLSLHRCSSTACTDSVLLHRVRKVSLCSSSMCLRLYRFCQCNDDC